MTLFLLCCFHVIARDVNEARKSEAEAWTLEAEAEAEAWTLEAVAEAWTPEARSWGHIPIFRLKSQNIKLLCNVHVMIDNFIII